jgi:methionine synthase II (cobalamin-independent)
MTLEFRAETIGSLLRPSYLMQARAARDQGTLPAAEFKRIEDRAVDEAIALQEELGLDVVSDGEMRRAIFMGPLYEAADGFEPIPSWEFHWTQSGTGREMDWKIPISATRPVRLRRSLATEEYAYARARATKPLKQTLPSPLLAMNTWNPAVSREAYPDPWDLALDGVEIVRHEARELVALGCTYIQIDAPEIPGFADPALGETWALTGIPMKRLLTDGLDLVNSVAEPTEGVTFAIHLCKGNNAGHWYSDTGYERLSQQIFSHLSNFDVFLLEYDDERSGGFEPLADCPDEKMVVLGLVSSKLPDLEDRDELARRVHDAAQYHPHDRLSLSTQCGFASVMEGNPVSEDAQRAKLQLVADVAHSLWPN